MRLVRVAIKLFKPYNGARDDINNPGYLCRLYARQVPAGNEKDGGNPIPDSGIKILMVSNAYQYVKIASLQLHIAKKKPLD